MPYLAKAVLLALVLGLGACSNPDHYDDDGDFGTGDGLMAEALPGDPGDPTSVAYFRTAVGDRVLFEVDQHTLSPEAKSVLLAQVGWLDANPEYTLLIEGHADERGTREYNIALGARRASSVQQYLISQGVDAGRLRTITYGKERPLELCSEERCYAPNRRAVTVLTAGAGS